MTTETLPAEQLHTATTPQILTAKVKGYEALLQQAEFYRYGLMVPFILATCCMAGVGLYYAADTFNLIIVSLLAICTVGPLSLMLAVAPMRIILPAVATSLLLSIGITLYYLPVFN